MEPEDERTYLGLKQKSTSNSKLDCQMVSLSFQWWAIPQASPGSVLPFKQCGPQWGSALLLHRCLEDRWISILNCFCLFDKMYLICHDPCIFHHMFCSSYTRGTQLYNRNRDEFDPGNTMLSKYLLGNFTWAHLFMVGGKRCPFQWITVMIFKY